MYPYHLCASRLRGAERDGNHYRTSYTDAYHGRKLPSVNDG